MSPRLATLPPVLDPACAAGLRDLVTLAAYARAKRTPRSATTLTPRHIVIAAAITMPALEHAARLGIARWQEAEERFR